MQLEAPSVWGGPGSVPAQAMVATADPAKWLAEEAWRISSPAEFVAALAMQFNAAGVPLATLHTHIRYLDPEIIGVSYFWKQEEADVHEMPIPPEMRERPTGPEQPHGAHHGGPAALVPREFLRALSRGNGRS